MAHESVYPRGGEFLLRAAEPAEVFTPEEFTEEHRLIRKTAVDFIEREVLPRNEEIEQQDFELVVQLLHKAGDLGLLAHSVPEAYGGLGLDKVSKAIVGEAVGMSGAYGVAHSNHTCIATLPITYFGTPEQKQKYLPKLASGEYLGAYCLTEPTAGSDALSGKTTARLNAAGTHYILNGTKQFITNAVFADTFIVYAKVDGEKFTAFIVERGFPGLKLGPEENKMGIKGSSTRQVYFEDCEVPVENLLGEIGRGHAIALNVLNLGRFNLGSGNIGGAKRALRLAAVYTSERRQFGRRLVEFPAIQEKLAQMAARIYAGESLQYRTAGLLEAALGPLYHVTDPREAESRLREHALECSICKVFGSETLDFVTDEALQVHGGYGFIKEYHVEQMVRDARIQRIFEGTNEINRLLIPTLFLRNVSRDPQALARLTAAAQGLAQPVEVPAGPLTRERSAVESIRRMFLAGAALLADTFHGRLDDQQELAIKLADLAILLYAAESAVVRAAKAAGRVGADAAAPPVDLAAAFVDDALLDAQRTASALFAGMLHGDRLYEALEQVQRLVGRHLDGASIVRKRRIAGKVAEAAGYPC